MQHKMINPNEITLKEAITQSHKQAKDKGFWDKKRNVGEALMLIVSELGEAIDADQKGRHYANVNKRNTNLQVMLNHISDEHFNTKFKQNVKDTFEDELADTAIRLFDLAEGLNIDLTTHILAKLRYNRSRSRLHGKNY